jgi:hypothetical protein
VDGINRFLDKFVLPLPVKYLTHRFVILATLLLIVPLILLASNTVFVLTANSYLNTMSVAVSSIVLLYATIDEVRTRKIAEMQEKRAQEDHSHVVEMHQMIIDNMQYQHEEIQNLKQILAELQGKTLQKETVPERLKSDVRKLHPRGHERFKPEDVRKRVEGAIAGRDGSGSGDLN